MVRILKSSPKAFLLLWYNLAMRRFLLVILLFATSGLFTWSLFGSFYIKEVIGQQCGAEAVVPCVMYDITRDVNILDQYRVYVVLITGLLLVTSLIMLFKFGKHRVRRT